MTVGNLITDEETKYLSNDIHSIVCWLTARNGRVSVECVTLNYEQIELGKALIHLCATAMCDMAEKIDTFNQITWQKGIIFSVIHFSRSIQILSKYVMKKLKDFLLYIYINL